MHGHRIHITLARVGDIQRSPDRLSSAGGPDFAARPRDDDLVLVYSGIACTQAISLYPAQTPGLRSCWRLALRLIQSFRRMGVKTSRIPSWKFLALGLQNYSVGILNKFMISQLLHVD